MRSVAVVFPASICAEIPMLRYRSMGVVRAIFPGISMRFAQLSMRFAQLLTGSKRPRQKNLYKAEPGYYQPRQLPAVVREGLVGLGHAVSVFTFAHRGAAILGGLHQLGGKAMRHRFLAAIRRRFDRPAHRQRLPAIGAHFHRYLVGGAA